MPKKCKIVAALLLDSFIVFLVTAAVTEAHGVSVAVNGATKKLEDNQATTSMPESFKPYTSQRATVGRHLQQDQQPSSEGGCTLTSEQLGSYLDLETRTWTIQDSVLRDVDNNLQTIVDCTAPEDIILFDVSAPIRPSSRVTIPWRLILSAAIEGVTPNDSIIPATPEKTEFECPSASEGLFRIRSQGALLANIKISGCKMSTGGQRAIIQTSPCRAENRGASVQLQHIEIVNNRLDGAAAVRIQSPSCLRLELTDVLFEYNTCSGVCGCHLTDRNILQSVIVRNNQRIEETPFAFFSGGAGSRTDIDGLIARRNGGTVITIVDGRVTLTNAIVVENESGNADDVPDGYEAVIQLDRTRATVRRSTFTGNRGNSGGVFNALASRLTLRNSTFNENSAVNGGGGWFSNSTVQDADNVYESNTAQFTGGGIWIDSNSSLVSSNCFASLNTATAGGFIRSGNQASVIVENGRFEGNSASLPGGTIFCQDTTLRATDCEFADGRANEGGFLYLTSAVADVDRSSFSEGFASFLGGCIAAAAGSTFRASGLILESSRSDNLGGTITLQSSNGTIRDSELTGNRAEDKGGAIAVGVTATFNIFNCTFFDNSATIGGGAILAEETSDFLVEDSTFTANGANTGGAMLLQELSRASINGSFFRQNIAANSGGTIAVDAAVMVVFTSCRFEESGNTPIRSGLMNAIRSNLSISDTVFTGGRAQVGGCALFDETTVYLQNTSFTNCSTINRAGAIALAGSNATFENLTLSSNVASGSGGGLQAIRSNVSINGAIIMNNTANFGGGIQAISTGTIILRNVLFRENMAVTDGGALIIENRVDGRVIDTEFVNNSATFSGGGFHSNDESDIVLNRCQFKQNRALFGGAISIVAGSSVKLHNSVGIGNSGELGGFAYFIDYVVIRLKNVNMTRNRATRQGGAIYIDEAATVNIRNSRMIGNSGEKFGGAILVKNAEVACEDVIFRNNKADDGGALMADDKGIVVVTASEFTQNAAIRGGALHISESTGARLSESTFKNNAASESGSDGHFYQSGVDVIDCSFMRCRAFNGGCFSIVRDSTISISGSTMTNGVVEDSGGFLLTDSSTVTLTDVSMTGGKGSWGGAVASVNSSLTALRFDASDCQAWNHGGVIYSNASSTLICAACRFEGNKANNSGGAVAFKSPRPQGLAVQFDNCSITKNAAHNGGGLHIIVLGTNRKCSVNDPGCTFVAIMRSQFSRNKARKAGGGIFSGSSEAILFSCEFDSPPLRQTFISTRELKSLSSLTNLDDTCDEWEKNTADGYGGDIATSVSSVQKEIVENNDERRGDVFVNDTYMIRRHRSGTNLPRVRFQLRDAFDQGPAIGSIEDSVFAYIASTEGFSYGDLRIRIQDGVGELPGVGGLQSPATYRVVVNFSEPSLPVFQLEIEVRDCIIGETETANGRFCQECTANNYNFDPKDEIGCKSCPQNANCSLQIIQPNKGYWNPSPCSAYIQECLNEAACNYKSRNEAFENFIRGRIDCDFTPEELDTYSDIQCTKGYRGPLCGSCVSSHGKTQSFKCDKCFTKSGNVMMVLFSILMLLGLSGFTVRSNTISMILGGITASSANRSRVQNQGPQLTTPIQSPSSATSSVPNNQIELIQVPGSTQPTSPQISSPAMNNVLPPVNQPQPLLQRTPSDLMRDEELARWKAVELFKIAINFMQVTAIALSINVDWHSGITTVLETVEVTSGVTTQASHRSLECLFDDDASVPRSITAELFVLLIPLIVFLIYAGIYVAISSSSVTSTWFVFSHRLILSACAICYLSYISVTKTLINILNCVKVNEDDGEDGRTRLWAVDTALECYKGSHVILASVVAWPFLFIFSIAFPVVTAYLIVKNVKLDYKEGWIYATTGFLYRSYQKKYLYWESIIMLRKALLATVVVFSYPLGGNLQGNLAVFVLAMALYMHLICKPYREKFNSLNKIESLSLLVTVITFLSSMFYNDERVSPEVRILITVGVCCCNIGIIVFFLGTFALFSAQYWEKILQRRNIPYNPTDGKLHVIRVYLTEIILQRLIDFVRKMYLICTGQSNRRKQRIRRRRGAQRATV